MVNQSQRGGQKQGSGKGEQKQHQGVRPGSTTQDKSTGEQAKHRDEDRTEGTQKTPIPKRD